MDDIEKKKHVSYSQFKCYLKCPHKFWLDYIKGIKEFEDSIFTCFGNSIHETIQLYIKTLYTESVEKADSINLIKHFQEGFTKELKDKKIEYTEDEHTDFSFDGEDILKEFSETAMRIKNFPKDKYEYVDVELEMEMPVKNNVNFLAYIDLVLREKKSGDIKIFDFKTSTNGWNSYKRENKIDQHQLLLYKAFYSKKFNIPLNKIDVEFFILKRRLYEKVTYPQSRIQIFIPPNKNKDVVDTLNTFIEFLTECFTPEGKYIEDIKNYPKNPAERKKNCTYCCHKKVRCDQKQELLD